MNNITPKELTDAGICPTCYNKEHDNVLFGDVADKMLFENKQFECFLVGNPRSNGHVAISSKNHYKDMMEAPNELIEEIFVFSKLCMNTLKAVYKSESVYLCTMCDGPMNHFHVQLIPRYNYEKRGSKNFVKERKEYIEEKDKVEKMRELLNKNYKFK